MKLDFLYLPCGREKVTLLPGKRYLQEKGPAYRDAPTEALEEITRRVGEGIPWREAVRAYFEPNHKWLCDIITHHSRDLFFRLQPPRSGARVLDVGSGWGQIARSLATRGFEVCALEPTTERLNFIQATAEQEGVAEKMCFVGCAYQDVEFQEKFDLITAIGVLEWCGKFREGTDPLTAQLDFLKKIRRDLNEGGSCVLGIENRFGLKYWLGAAGDHTGVPGIEILEARLARAQWQRSSGSELRIFTYTMAEYREMLRTAGFQEIHFFAAFPDYKLPQQIIAADEAEPLSDFFLRGGFVREHDGSNGQLLSEDFQERLGSHYRSLADLGIVNLFSPSYFITAC